MSDTLKKFPIPQIERAVHESLNPTGMSTHSGKVTLDVSWVQRLLILAEPLLRQEIENAVLERAAKVCEELRHPNWSEEDHAWIMGTEACAGAIRAMKVEK